MKRNALVIIVMVALLALAGCVSGIQIPDQSNVKLPDLSVPVCFNALPLQALFYKNRVFGVQISLSADWLIKNGFSTIGEKAVRRTTFPAIVKEKTWGWVVMDEDSLQRAILILPDRAIWKGIPRGDVYVLSENSTSLLINSQSINWLESKNFSAITAEGRLNLQELALRFRSVVDGDFANTDLEPSLFREQRKRSSRIRRVAGAAPPISITLLFPPSWPIYGLNWAGNSIASEIALGGSGIASCEEINKFLEPYDPNHPEVKNLLEALERRQKEKQIQSASAQED